MRIARRRPTPLWRPQRSAVRLAGSLRPQPPHVPYLVQAPDLAAARTIECSLVLAFAPSPTRLFLHDKTTYHIKMACCGVVVAHSARVELIDVKATTLYRRSMVHGGFSCSACGAAGSKSIVLTGLSSLDSPGTAEPGRSFSGMCPSALGCRLPALRAM